MVGFVAECFWPGVSERDLRALDERAERRVAELSQGGENVRYLGSLGNGQEACFVSRNLDKAS